MLTRCYVGRRILKRRIGANRYSLGVRFPRLLTALFVFVLILLACAPAHAGAPTERLREFFGKVNAILADPATADQPLERVARVRRLVTEITDMNAASAAALGTEWPKRTFPERTEFIGLFADLLERAYVGRLAGAVRVTGSVTMTYLDEMIAGSDATVHTALRGLGGHDMRVEYMLVARGGKWRVRDIVLDGVSTIDNYNAQFRRLLGQDSYAALIEGLKAKLAEESLMFAALERRPAAPAVTIVDSDLTTPPMDDAPLPRRTVTGTAEALPPSIAPERFAPRAVTRDEPPVAPKPKPVAAVVAAVVAPVSALVTPDVPAEPPVVTPAAMPREVITIEPATPEPHVSEAMLTAITLGVFVTSGAVLLRRRSSH